MRQSDQLQCCKYVLYVAGVSTCPPRMSVAASFVPLTSQQTYAAIHTTKESCTLLRNQDILLYY